mgnify:CR=1 FL=1
MEPEVGKPCNLELEAFPRAAELDVHEQRAVLAGAGGYHVTNVLLHAVLARAGSAR